MKAQSGGNRKNGAANTPRVLSGMGKDPWANTAHRVVRLVGEPPTRIRTDHERSTGRLANGTCPVNEKVYAERAGYGRRR
jgi:hypothetical protein